MTAEVHAAVRAQLEALEGVVLDNTKARMAEAQRTIQRLAAEKLVLLVEKEQLQIKFEASHAALGVAVSALDRANRAAVAE